MTSYSANVLLQDTLNNLDDAVVLFPGEPNKAITNTKFHALPEEVIRGFMLSDESTISHHAEMLASYNLVLQPMRLAKGNGYIIREKLPPQTRAQQTLKAITRALKDNHEIYTSAAAAIQKILGWRWVSISQFITPSKLQVMAFVDGAQPHQLPSYEIAGTPCETVLRSKAFTHYADLSEAFPNYLALHEMGAKSYAGLIYRGHDNQPIGHVMAMHDAPIIDAGIAEEVVTIATIALSAQFQLKQKVSQLAVAEQRAKTDPLTNIGNRKAFDDALLQAERDYQTNASEYNLAVVDLDRLKPLNDQLGHAAGDKFIQLMASELSTLGRDSDQAFRIGGDEFAILFSNSGEAFQQIIRQRLARALQRVRKHMKFDVDASIGFASLREVDGNTQRCYKLADQRMYAEKKSHHQHIEKIIPIARKLS